MRVRLNQLGEIITGNTPSKKNIEFWNSKEIYFIKPDVIFNNGVINISSSNEYISNAARKKARIVGENAIFVTCIGSIGKIGIAAKGEYAFNQQINAIIPNEKIIPKYLAYNLLFNKPRLIEIANAAVVPIINKSQFGEFLINIESNKEKQAEVVQILDKLTYIIQKHEEEIRRLDDLIKSRFVEMFGDLSNPECLWDKRKLIDVCSDKDDIKCGPFGTQLNKGEYMEVGIAVWEIPQINTGFLTRPTHFLTKEKAEQLKAYTIIPGDIAMSRKGNVGKCALFPEDYPVGIIHSDVLRIRVDCKRVNSLFMMCQLHFSEAVTRQIELVSAGAIMAGVNVTKLKQIYIYVPPIELQNKFADFVHQVDKSKLTFTIPLNSPLPTTLQEKTKESEKILKNERRILWLILHI